MGCLLSIQRGTVSIDQRLTAADAYNDILIEVRIRLETLPVPFRENRTLGAIG